MGEKDPRVIFWDNTGLLQASVPFFRDPLLQSSLLSLSCKGPSMRLLCVNHRFPKPLLLHMHLMTLKYWTEAEFIGCTGYGGDHKPSPCFAFPQPALIFQHLVYWYACSWMGSKSPVHKLFPFVTLADNHETMQEVTVIEYCVVRNKGLSRQC